MKEIDIEEKEMLLHGNKYFIHIPKGKVDSKTGLKASEGWDFDKIPDVRQFRDGKKAKKLKTDNIKLINISDVNIIHKGKEKTPFIILPDDVECAELNDMTYCVQKDFDGKKLKVDLHTKRGVRVCPPPNWRAKRIGKAAKGKDTSGRKRAFADYD